MRLPRLRPLMPVALVGLVALLVTLPATEGAAKKGFKMKMGGNKKAPATLWPGAGKDCSEGYDHDLVDLKKLGTIGGRSVVTEEAVFIGDVDGDGDIDLVTASHRDNSTTVAGWHKNDGKGSFSYERISAGGHRGATQIGLADFDGDGDLDIAHGNADQGNGWPGGLSLYENTGGAFTEHAFFTGEDATDTLVGDFDGDGSPDIAYRNKDNKFVYVANTAKDASAWSDPRSMGPLFKKLKPFRAHDVDGDGDTDVFFNRKMDGYEREFGWLENVKKGRKWKKRVINSESALESITLLDIDGDGDLDAMGGYIRALTVLNNTDGKGTFSATQLLLRKAYYQTDAASFVELDGDADPELIIGGSGGHEWLKVMDYDRKTKTCRFGTAFKGKFGGTKVIYAADLDGDGDQDVIAGANRRPLVWLENANK